MTDTPRNVMRVLQKLGFVPVRQTGSHRIFQRGSTIIPVPDHPGDMKTGTFYRILKLAGLSLDEYLRLRREV